MRCESGGTRFLIGGCTLLSGLVGERATFEVIIADAGRFMKALKEKFSHGTCIERVLFDPKQMHSPWPMSIHSHERRTER